MSVKRSSLGRVLRQIIGPLIGAAVVGYFAYHTVEGERGLVALTQLQVRVNAAEKALSEVRGERQVLERRARLLRPDNLDPDMLDEQGRRVLDVAGPDDLVVLTPPRAPALTPDTAPAHDGDAKTDKNPLNR